MRLLVVAEGGLCMTSPQTVTKSSLCRFTMFFSLLFVTSNIYYKNCHSFNSSLLLSQAGDIITNLESVDEEWFQGDLRGKRALVPKNYVQVL